MSKYERLARLLKIITLVRANHRLKRPDLARLCEVDSVRTIQRDIDSLSIAGVPIYWSGEGYEIMPGFFLPPLSLNAEEALCIVAAVGVFCEDKGKHLQGTTKVALSKVMDVLPDQIRRQLEDTLGRANWDFSQLVDKLNSLSEP